jgi:DNA (cytosine-5)-methyltransferase 1
MTPPDVQQALQLLQTAYTRMSRAEIADALGYSERSIERWEYGQLPSAKIVIHALTNVLREVPHRELPPADFTFIDLFAGIGGTRMAFEQSGGRCVFTSEYDDFCVKTYKANFRPDHDVVGDIRDVTKTPERVAAMVPDHDVLVAGFPCQPFSIAGVSKKNSLGRAHGFECETQGTLFFDICRILEVKRPAAFMLENVRNLRTHDKRRTFEVIERSLRDLGYTVKSEIIDAKPWTPQHRERIYIVGFREETAFDFSQMNMPKGSAPTLAKVLHPENGTESPEAPFTEGAKARVSSRYYLTDHLWAYLQAYRDKHRAAGNGFGFGLVNRKMTARTLSARYHKDGSEILVDAGKRKNPRRLTPRECARLMGFPDTFRILVSDTQAYRQFGNSVVVPVVRAVAATMHPHVVALKSQQETRQVGLPV